MGIFYFCGHGVEQGAGQFLITESFGCNDDETLADAVYLTGLFEGMNRCLARKQLFLIDACRNAPAALTDRIVQRGGGAGAPAIIEPIAKDQPTTINRNAAILFATASAGTAFAPQANAM